MNNDVETLLSRGVVEVIDLENLKKKLASGKKLRVKLGIDPTSPNIHIGRAVSLWKLRAFQDLGHTAIFIIGDFTGMIGDTSDKDSERPMLSIEQVKENMKSYLDQAFKILDKDKTEIHYNSEWLSKLGYLEISKMASLFSVHSFISREVIAKRLDIGQRVSAVEAFYPLMQGYDSVAVTADVELGGTDQRYNLLAGRKIQPLYNQEPQDVVMTELLEGLDGRKMSSSWGNVINITDEPNDMFGKVMSIKDELVPRYFELATDVDMQEVEEISKGHPKEYKISLAKDIVRRYYGREVALQAADNFIKAFSKGGIPEDILTVKAEMETPLVEILIANNILSSKSEFTRLDKEGAIKEMGEGVYRVGKHRFIKIVRS